MGRGIPDRAICLGQRLFGGEADVAQEVVIQLCQAPALTAERQQERQTAQERQPARKGGPMQRCGGGNRAEHGCGFHVKW